MFQFVKTDYKRNLFVSAQILLSQLFITISILKHGIKLLIEQISYKSIMSIPGGDNTLKRHQVKYVNVDRPYFKFAVLALLLMISWLLFDLHRGMHNDRLHAHQIFEDLNNKTSRLNHPEEQAKEADHDVYSRFYQNGLLEKLNQLSKRLSRIEYSSEQVLANLADIVNAMRTNQQSKSESKIYDQILKIKQIIMDYIRPLVKAANYFF